MKFALAVSAALLLASCNPNGQKSASANTSAAPAAAATTSVPAPHVRRACADEIQKYCANEPHKRRCLKDNRDKLSDGCKAALDAPRDPNRKHEKKDSQKTGDDD